MPRKVRLTQVDMFSGIGGMLLAGRMAGFDQVMGCEYEPFCRAVLADHFPGLHIEGDIHDVASTEKVGVHPIATTVLTGSAPFQANYARGAQRRNDPSDLWAEFVRVARELRPSWVLAETFPRFASLGFDDAAWDLEREGFAVTAVTIPAQAVDCPLRKDRLYIVGARGGDPRLLGPEPGGFELKAHRWPAPGPDLHRVAERLPNGMDWHVAALHTLGDATVPRAAEAILRGIAEAERHWLVAKKPSGDA